MIQKVCSKCYSDWENVKIKYGYRNNSQRWKCNNCGSEAKPCEVDKEVVAENVRYKKQSQRLADQNRKERKAFREHSRIENAIEAVGEELVSTIKVHGKKLGKWSPPKIEDDGDARAIIQINDTHFNELVSLRHNKYDMSIASQRLHTFVCEAKRILIPQGVKSVVVALGGDLMNSDRRLDEILNKATSRSKAMFVAVDLLKHVILDLRQDFNITVVSVLGNESRVNDTMSYDPMVLSDNYDYMIANMLRVLLEASGIEGVSFGPLDEMELVVDVFGWKVLITHDYGQRTKDQKKQQSEIGRRYLTGSPADIIICGHLHSTKNEIISYRGGSLPGANTYSENGLGLYSRASQNIYVFRKNSYFAVPIDLQVPSQAGYDIEDILDEYDCKSAKKNKSTTRVLEVVI